MYLEYLIQEDVIQNEILNNEDLIYNEFQKTFSTNDIYRQVYENLNSLIVKDNLVESFDNIKEFAKNYTLNYLVTTSKRLNRS